MLVLKNEIFLFSDNHVKIFTVLVRFRKNEKKSHKKHILHPEVFSRFFKFSFICLAMEKLWLGRTNFIQ
jgi:hypothetical protein